MDTEKSKEVLKSFGNPSIKVGKKYLIFTRQSQKDVVEIESMSDEALIAQWKNLCYMNLIYGQVSLNEMQRIQLIELEFESRKTINKDELFQWYKKSEEDCEIENIAAEIEEVAEHRGWENSEYIAKNKYGEEKVSKARKLFYDN